MAGKDNVTRNSCKPCEGLCCRYFALEIDKPEDREDFQTLAWYLCHKGCYVYVADGDWHLCIDNECKYLDAKHRCTIYEERPKICRDHEVESCEFCADLKHDLEFHTREEVLAYGRAFLARKRRKKKSARKKKGAA